MRDRLSIHLENGQSDGVREAVTVLRNGGTAAQSGLVGITNTAYDPLSECLDVFMPQTILHVHSTGDSNIRMSSGPSNSYRSSLELIGNGYQRASGLHITYDPSLDDSQIGPDTGYPFQPPILPGVADNTVVDFSLIEPSGDVGMEFTFMSVTEKGYVAIGQPRVHTQRHFHANAPLTIAYMSDEYTESGTISIHQQPEAPATLHNGFGKVYVKPYSVGGRTQALYFQDDNGNETNLVLSQDLDPTVSEDGLIYCNSYGNVFGGCGTPATRYLNNTNNKNTFYGYYTGHELIKERNPQLEGDANCNSLFGYRVGSGLLHGSLQNTAMGCDTLHNFSSADNTIALGYRVAFSNNLNATSVRDAILIGSELFNNEDISRGTLAIGHGQNPVVTGSLISDKSFAVNKAKFIISDTSIINTFESQYDSNDERYFLDLEIKDTSVGGSNYGNHGFSISINNDDNTSLTLFKIDPLGEELTNVPNYATTNKQFTKIDTDVKLKGAIRFQDGTSLSGLSEYDIQATLGTSGVNKVLELGNSTNYFVLDYSGLDLAGNVSSNIRTDNTFVAVQLDGTDSDNVGKMSLQGLADYVSSGTASIGENCNVLISNPENELNVNTAANSNSVMIGCGVATNASGWKHSVIIGSEAGVDATTPNAQLDVDTAAVFIGWRAGYDCDEVDNVVFIGSNAGKNSDNGSDTIYVGTSAGESSNYDNSIGLGENALRGAATVPSTGTANIEIVAGKLDNQRLMYQVGNISNRLNIQNTIAGRTDSRNVSVGDARLSPTAPLEVRRQSVIHASNLNNFVQSWYCDDALVASLNCDGSMYFPADTVDGNLSAEKLEGIMEENVSPPASIAAATSGLMSVYVDGVDTNTDIYVSNRDKNLTLSNNSYVLATIINGEYRPTWVSC